MRQTGRLRFPKHLSTPNYAIASDRLTVLAWGDPRVPKQLKEMWHTGTLPTPQDIQAELDAAWGFNFYLRRELLILRFPSSFAKWYVDKTFRHPTFRAIAYNQLPKLITQKISHPQECQQLLNILNKRSSEDTYYTAWIRTGDINVLMRLRDWRPKGEVIAPRSIRQQLAEEAAQELAHYHETGK
ncbi:MAG: TIGR03985 family CRISPR-associated protein [Rhizonema sp. PD37]|nr:TIGR03985 family CRISPR-associated protein [Rhizonema sp. PD37]